MLGFADRGAQGWKRLGAIATIGNHGQCLGHPRRAGGETFMFHLRVDAPHAGRMTANRVIQLPAERSG